MLVWCVYGMISVAVMCGLYEAVKCGTCGMCLYVCVVWYVRCGLYRLCVLCRKYRSYGGMVVYCRV